MLVTHSISTQELVCTNDVAFTGVLHQADGTPQVEKLQAPTHAHACKQNMSHCPSMCPPGWTGPCTFALWLSLALRQKSPFHCWHDRLLGGHRPPSTGNVRRTYTITSHALAEKWLSVSWWHLFWSYASLLVPLPRTPASAGTAGCLAVHCKPFSSHAEGSGMRSG